MTASLSWSDGWAYFRVSEPEIQEDFIQQIEIERLLKRCAPKIQQEIMEDAPEEVLHNVIDFLHEETLKSLGMEKEIMDRTMRSFYGGRNG